MSLTPTPVHPQKLLHTHLNEDEEHPVGELEDCKEFCSKDEHQLNYDAARIFALWKSVQEAKAHYEMNPPMQEILVQTMYFDHAASSDFDPIEWAQKDSDQREEGFCNLARSLAEVVFRVTRRGDLEMLRQLSCSNRLDVLRYIHQHRGKVAPYPDHELIFAALDIGRVDILRFYHDCGGFVSFPSLCQEEHHRLFDDVFDAFVDTFDAFDDVFVGQREARSRSHVNLKRFRWDKVTAEQIVECMDFLGSVGVQVQSPRFLRRLLDRAVSISHCVLVRYVLSQLPASANCSQDNPTVMSLFRRACRSAFADVVAAFLDSPHCLNSWRHEAVNVAFGGADSDDVVDLLLQRKFFSLRSQTRFTPLLQVIGIGQWAILCTMIRVHGVAICIQEALARARVESPPNSYLMTTVRPALVAANEQRNRNVRCHFDVFDVPTVLIDLIFQFENYF